MNDILEGECKRWNSVGVLVMHDAYVKGGPLGLEMGELSDKYRFELTLRYGVRWL
jgi:hypothetical protein